MAKEWILNSAMNRFQLNFKRNVGAVSDQIRKCSPKSMSEWEQYYFDKVYDKAHIESLGKKAFGLLCYFIAMPTKLKPIL